MNFRGLDILASYLCESARLTFQIPALGISETFEGIDRDDTQQKLKDFVRDNTDNILKRILRGMIAETPIDPIAGNPASFTGQMISDSFAAGTEGFRPEKAAICCSRAAFGPRGKHPNQFQSFSSMTVPFLFLLPDVGYYKAGDYRQTTFTLPLSSTIYLNYLDLPLQLRFDLPLNYSRVEDADSYSGALGASLRIPLPSPVIFDTENRVDPHAWNLRWHSRFS